MRSTARIATLYGGLTAIFVASFLFVATLPAGEILQRIAGNVGIAALIGALFLLFRDYAAYDRELLLRRDDQQFQIGDSNDAASTV